MILILTNSTDGTSDVLVPLFISAGVPVFRWNIDLWDQYEIKVTPGGFTIRDPVGRLCDVYSPKTFMLWRKPFADLIQPTATLDENDIQFVRSEMREVGRTLHAIFASRGALALIDPSAELRLPKLVQVEQAKRYFHVPDFEFSIQGASLVAPAIAKPIGKSEVGKRIFFTRKADPERLVRPHPWYVQSAIVGGVDATCVVIDGSQFFFSSGFVRDEEKIDWRTEINAPQQSRWETFTSVSSEVRSSVSSLMKDFSLSYGRIDFIVRDGTFWFLECNPNGQFGWLDDVNWTLHRTFASAALKACGHEEAAMHVVGCKVEV